MPTRTMAEMNASAENLGKIHHDFNETQITDVIVVNLIDYYKKIDCRSNK